MNKQQIRNEKKAYKQVDLYDQKTVYTIQGISFDIKLIHTGNL